MADPNSVTSLSSLVFSAPLAGAVLAGILYIARELRAINRETLADRSAADKANAEERKANAEERLTTATRHTAVIDKIIDKQDKSNERQSAALSENTAKLGELNTGCVQTREAMARATQAMEGHTAP